ncbi:transposase [Deinococcus sp. Arct2-2]|uniref:transposase n=1 Tax=Deinococcus sp. Arct2-2 TaxID=2568653 RepID=UPI001454C0F3|nr:transposase [Deinococcus sp. Arct2-2]
MGLGGVLQHVVQAVKLRKTQRKFFAVVLSVFLALPGRLNALDLSHDASCSDRTIRRWLHRGDEGAVPWWSLQTAAVTTAMQSGLISPLCILAIDASFHQQSGTKTAHLGPFWNGCATRVERGIEHACCALIKVQHRHIFPLHARQTRTDSEAPGRMEQITDQLEEVLLDLRAPPQIELAAIVADGDDANISVVETVTGHGFPLVSKRPRNANLKSLYAGEHVKRRRQKKTLDGKVNFHDLRRFELVCETPTQRLLSQVVWGCHWRRALRAVVIQQLDSTGTGTGYAVLFSTAVTLPAHDVVALSQSRFEIELVFRDEKQFLLALNLARLEALQAAGGGQGLVFSFSLEDLKRRAYNALLAQVILSTLGLEARFEESGSLPSRPLDFGLKAA